MPSCAISTCKNTDRTLKRGKDFSFHRFPADDKLSRIWKHKCKRKDEFNCSRALVCSDHFQKEDFEIDKMNRALNLKERHLLKHGAIPSKNLPLQTTNTDENRKERLLHRNVKKSQREIVEDVLHRDSGHSNDDSCTGTIQNEAETSTDSSVQTDSSYLDLQLKLNLLESEVKKSKKELKKLRCDNLVLKNKTKILQKRTLNRKRKMIQNNLHSKLSKLFSTPQMKKLFGQRRVNWSTEDIAKALSVASMSKSAYETFRKSWGMPLPSPRSLTEWTRHFKCQPGVLVDVIALMKEEGKSMDKFNKLCVINFDEMSVTSEVTFDPSTDTVTGPYKNAQVVIVNGLCKKWRQPIYYNFDTKVTKELLYELIGQLELADYKVCAIVSDFGGTNRALWNEIDVSSVKSYFKNPVDSNQNIWVFADAPHMLKLLRNHLLDHGWALKNGTVVGKSILEHLISFDCGEIRLCPKLTSAIIEVKGAERMKVSPAAKVFSHHTATLSTFCFPEQPEIGQFFQEIDDYFDIFNSRFPYDNDKLIRSGYGINLEKQNERLDEIRQTVLSMRSLFYSKKLKKIVPRKSLLPCQHGIIASIDSLKGLLKDVKEMFQVSYILTRRLNQDPLESLFSVIRALGKTNDHPTPSSFRSRMKIVLLGSKLTGPTGANVTPDNDGHYYISTKLFEYVISQHPAENLIETAEELAEMFPENMPSEMTGLELEETSGMYTTALKYISGYLAFVMKKKHGKSYGVQTKNVNRDELPVNIYESWILELSRGGLMEPSEQCSRTVELCDLTFRRCFPSDKILNVNGITRKVERRLCYKHPELDQDLVKEFAKLRIKIRVKLLNTVRTSNVAANINCVGKKRMSAAKSLKNLKKAKQFVQ